MRPEAPVGFTPPIVAPTADLALLFAPAATTLDVAEVAGCAIGGGAGGGGGILGALNNGIYNISYVIKL